MSDPGDSSHDGLRARVSQLETRIGELEAERDELARENSELLVFQQVLSTINSSLEIDDILAIVLRGVHEALRFKRVVLFDFAEGSPRRRQETGPDGLVIPSRSGDFRETPALRGIVDKRLDYHVGSPTDGESPIDDPRGAYALIPLISRDIVRGVLYVEDAPTDQIGDSELRILLNFSAQGAIAIENAELLAETQRLALTDSLTGLLNRRALEQMLDRELHNAERYGSHLGYVIFDLDDLKHINDSGGHRAGDAALSKLADVLRSTSRKGDIVARYAGDEFVVIMTNTNRGAAHRGIERVFENMHRVGIKASAGAAIFPHDGADAVTLFHAADGALYGAKQAGKDRFLFFDMIAETPA